MSSVDDSFDDYPFPMRRHTQATMAGLYALISALVGIGLLAILVVLWFIISQEPNVGGGPWLIVVVSFTFDGLAFIAGLAAIILGTKAVSPGNPLYRGYGVLGLIGGVLLVLVTLALGFMTFCCGLLLHVPGG